MSVSEINKIKNLKELKKIMDKVININIITLSVGAGKNNALILLKNYLYNLVKKQKEYLRPDSVPKINLKRIFNKKYTSTKRLSRIYEKNLYINRNIGIVPRIFLENTENKKERVNKLYDLFAKYSLILNYDYSHDLSVSFVKIPFYTKEFADELTILINKKVEISFIGNGYFGNGYKITVFEENKKYDFFYKTFFPYSNVVKHGADLEVIYAYFANRHSRKNQFVRFFMGRLATPYEKDVFLLTEFVQNNEKINTQNTRLTLDYLYSQDKRIDNTINGKIIDFGAVREWEPELNNNELRKIVRLIVMRLSKTIDKNNVLYNWKMSKKNCSTLKQYINKVNFDLYKQALNIIKRNFNSLPDEVFNDLINIKEWDNIHQINETRYLQTKDIVNLNLNTIKRNAQILNLVIKTSVDGINNMFGYMILDLFKNRQVIIFLDNENNITKMRFEKLIEGEYVSVLELSKEEIPQYKNNNIISIFNTDKEIEINKV